MLAAMNTGHEGGCGTIHANSAADVPSRVEGLAMAAGLGRDAAHSQLASAVHLVVHLTRSASGRRRLEEIGVLCRRDDGMVQVRPAARFDEDGRLRSGEALDDLAALVEP
jgi:pilus assembly protein CpaF